MFFLGSLAAQRVLQKIFRFKVCEGEFTDIWASKKTKQSFFLQFILFEQTVSTLLKV